MSWYFRLFTKARGSSSICLMAAGSEMIKRSSCQNAPAIKIQRSTKTGQVTDPKARKELEHVTVLCEPTHLGLSCWNSKDKLDHVSWA